MKTRTPKLTTTDQGHLKCAEGWLELGDHVSAFDELEKIEPLCRAYPDVLKVRWRIYNKAGKHGNAFTIAEGLTRLLPGDPEMFIWRSHSVRRMQGGGVEQALQLLLDVAHDFPDETAVPFDLARYNCALGKLAEAKNWLHIAFAVAERNGTAKEWKTRTLDEPDLAPLRKEFSL